MLPLHKNKEYYDNTEWTIQKVREEIDSGLSLINKIDKPIVTFFGSHRVKIGSNYYNHCKNLAVELGKMGYAIMSGGGPGIMHAANSGATEAKVQSIGLPAELLKGEKVTDNIFTHTLPFHFIFARRFIMSIKSEALIFYPGGYGTLNELFEYAMLMQTSIVDTVPIICINKTYWKGLFDWLKNNPLKNDFFTDSDSDISLIKYADDLVDVISLIRK